ncbi:MAG: PIG-L family deacetylase [Alphaproteobacteria bacterium]|nr:PIG-L family deacetylase [Alphaproteobacteria bacterium]MDE2011739.1 PIG-L family deacetylase [Alphaproteobacteria bacterium]MDE2072965.1 PIG-L family deacetylase [Alphaproteobacteria bacterium]
MTCCSADNPGGHPARALLPQGQSALVVAHPDDEALWLSSAVASTDRVVFCFGDPYGRPKTAAARRNAVAHLTLPGLVNLAIPESGALHFVDWRQPTLTPYGVAVTDAAVRARYEANYVLLVAQMRSALAGVSDVYTHNPWGEYGHPDHIQVHRAVAALQAELGYTAWFTNYAGPDSWQLARKLAAQPYWTERRSVAPDRVLARQLMRIYQQSGAWTWSRTHRWPRQECLYAMPPDDDPRPRHGFSGEYLLEVFGAHWWPPFRRTRLRRLE